MKELQHNSEEELRKKIQMLDAEYLEKNTALQLRSEQPRLMLYPNVTSNAAGKRIQRQDI